MRGRKHLQPAHAGHDYIDQRDVKAAAAQGLESGLAVGGLLDYASIGFQAMTHHETNRGVIVGDQNGSVGGSSGALGAGTGRSMKFCFAHVRGYRK